MGEDSHGDTEEEEARREDFAKSSRGDAGALRTRRKKGIIFYHEPPRNFVGKTRTEEEGEEVARSSRRPQTEGLKETLRTQREEGLLRKSSYYFLR